MFHWLMFWKHAKGAQWPWETGLVLCLIAGSVSAAPDCSRLTFVPVSYPLVALDSNAGLPGPITTFAAPSGAKCAELNIVTALETTAPLVGDTVAGIIILDENNQQNAAVKVLGRAGFAQYANENSMTVTAPVVAGSVRYQLFTAYPAGSDGSTTTGVVVSVVGMWR